MVTGGVGDKSHGVGAVGHDGAGLTVAGRGRILAPCRPRPQSLHQSFKAGLETKAKGVGAGSSKVDS